MFLIKHKIMFYINNTHSSRLLCKDYSRYISIFHAKNNYIQLPFLTWDQLLERAAAYKQTTNTTQEQTCPAGFEILIPATNRLQKHGHRYETLNEYKLIAVLTSLLVLSVVQLMQCLCIKWHGEIVHTAFTERVFRNFTPEI